MKIWSWHFEDAFSTRLGFPAVAHHHPILWCRKTV